MKGPVILTLIFLISTVAKAQTIGEEYAQYEVYTSINRAKKQKDKVVVLDLSGKKLNVIPKVVFEMKNLKVLKLSNNKIDSIPSEISSLHSLEVLYLNGNSLKKFPIVLTKMPNLKFLLMSSNHISKLPLEITSLKNLVRLDLLFNELSDSDVIQIRSLMPDCKIFIEARID